MPVASWTCLRDGVNGLRVRDGRDSLILGILPTLLPNIEHELRACNPVKKRFVVERRLISNKNGDISALFSCPGCTLLFCSVKIFIAKYLSLFSLVFHRLHFIVMILKRYPVQNRFIAATICYVFASVLFCTLFALFQQSDCTFGYLKMNAIFFILLFYKAQMEESQEVISIKSQQRPFCWGGAWTFLLTKCENHCLNLNCIILRWPVMQSVNP